MSKDRTNDTCNDPADKKMTNNIDEQYPQNDHINYRQDPNRLPEEHDLPEVAEDQTEDIAPKDEESVPYTRRL